MRKILSLVLSIAMVMSCFGMTAFAADEANTVGDETYANGSFADACYTPDKAVWTKATDEIQAADANGTYVGNGIYYTTVSLNGSGENVTSVLMTNASATDPKCVFAMNNATKFNDLTDLTDADRIHYSGYFNVIQGTVSSANILPANAGGIDISQNLLDQKSNFGVNNGRWVRFDVFYQPTITYTYTKTDTDGNVTTGTWKSNQLQQARNSNAVTSGVDFSKMPGYDSTCKYTATKSTHGLTSSYINGEPVIEDVASDSGFPGTLDWDNLASRIAFHGSGAVVAFAQGKMELIRNFDASTYDFVDYPELTSGEKYKISGNNLIYNQPITAADIAAPAGFTVAAYSDTACTKPVTGAISLGDTIAVSNGPIISYYEASDGRGAVITTTMSNIHRSTHSVYNSSLAGKSAPFTKITKLDNSEDNAFFEVSFGSRYPSIDTEKYYVLEMNYLPESDGAYLYIGGQFSTGLGVADLTLTDSTLVQNQWNKIVVVLENGSTEANPYPANKKDYASEGDAKTDSPHTLSLYCNGKLVSDKVKTQLGMIWKNGGRAENFFRIQVLPTNTTAETYAYVDDVVLYGTDNFTAADAALPVLSSVDFGTIDGNTITTAADASVINAVDGLTVLGKTEGIVNSGDVIAYESGNDVAYYKVKNNFFPDRDGYNASLGWDVDGTTLRIYDIPGVGTGGMPSFEGANGANLAPWANVSGITDIVIEDGITHVGKWTIAGKEVNSVTIPSSVSAFDGYAFNTSTITTLIFEEGCTGFNSDCKINRDCNIKNVYLPSTAKNIHPYFWRGLNTESNDNPYCASNKIINIYAPADSDAYTWATTIRENKPKDVIVNVSKDYSDRLYTFVRKSYLSGIDVSNGKGALGAGASGDSNDTSIECYSTNPGEGNAFIGGPYIDAKLFAKRDYAVFEADVKFTENSKYFFYGSNQHKQISPNVYSDNVLLLDGWNRVMTVVERATGNAKTYINGLLYVEAPGAVLGENTNTATRFIFYNNDNGISEEVPVGYVDNMAIYATNVNPAATFTAPLTATADPEAGVTFTVSDDVKALASNVVIAAAYDAVGNMLGNVVIASDSVTIAPVAGATKYVGYVWNSLEGLAPITASLAVNVDQ